MIRILDTMTTKVIRTGTSDDQWLGTHHVILLYDTTGPHDVSMVTMLVEQNLARHCNPDVSAVTIATCTMVPLIGVHIYNGT